jgi:DNA-binding MarR family transcriptional regulator
MKQIIRTAPAPFDPSHAPLRYLPNKAQALDEALAKAQLSAEQWNSLVYFANFARFSQAAPTITSSGRSAQSATSRMLRRLEERGLIQRLAVGPKHSRTTHVILTDTGWDLIRRIVVVSDNAHA